MTKSAQFGKTGSKRKVFYSSGKSEIYNALLKLEVDHVFRGLCLVFTQFMKVKTICDSGSTGYPCSDH